MEDGPARRTRSVTSIEKRDFDQPFNSSMHANTSDDYEVFKTPINTPLKQKRRKDKVRTPSGNELSGSVEDIRNFFSKSQSEANSPLKSLRPNYALFKATNSQSDSIKPVSPCALRSNRQTADRPNTIQPAQLNTVQSTEKFIAKTTDCTTIDTDKVSNEPIQIFNSIETENDSDVRINKHHRMSQTPDNTMASNNIEHNEELKDFFCTKAISLNELAIQREKEVNYRYKREQLSSKQNECATAAEDPLDLQQVATEVSTDSDTTMEAIDVKVVYQMFREIKQEMTKTNIVNGEQRLSAVEKRQDMIIDALFSIKQDMEERKMQTNLLSGVLSHLGQVVNDMDTRIEKVELNNMRKSAILTGLYTTTKKPLCIKEVKRFILEEIGIQADIDDVFFLSKTTSSPMVIKFSTVENKAAVFDNAKNLKGLVNEYNKSYYINHYLPPTINEQRRRELDVLRQNELLGENKLQVDKTEGKLALDGIPYERKVKVPTVHQLLSLPKDAFDDAMDIPIVKGKVLKDRGNVFIGYTLATNNMTEIQKAYYKLKMLYASARHIVCSYRIPGNRSFECEDYCEDGDVTCGRAIFRWMKENQLDCRAFFVVRKCGEKLGTARFTNYIKATKLALEMDPINRINSVNQYETLVQEEGTPTVTTTTPKTKVQQQSKYDTYHRPDNRSERRGGFGKRLLQPRGRTKYNQLRGGLENGRRSDRDRNRDRNNDRDYVYQNKEDWHPSEKEWPPPTPSPQKSAWK